MTRLSADSASSYTIARRSDEDDHRRHPRLAKIEKGTIKLEQGDFDLRDAIEQACVARGLEATAKGLALEMQIADEVSPWVYGDGGSVRQVLLNLAGNAVKFTAQGGVEVRIGRAAEDAQSRVRFEVRDTGIGIDPSSLERMFEPLSKPTCRWHGTAGTAWASRSPRSSSSAWPWTR